MRNEKKDGEYFYRSLCDNVDSMNLLESMLQLSCDMNSLSAAVMKSMSNIFQIYFIAFHNYNASRSYVKLENVDHDFNFAFDLHCQFVNEFWCTTKLFLPKDPPFCNRSPRFEKLFHTIQFEQQEDKQSVWILLVSLFLVIPKDEIHQFSKNNELCDLENIDNIRAANFFLIDWVLDLPFYDDILEKNRLMLPCIFGQLLLSDSLVLSKSSSYKGSKQERAVDDRAVFQFVDEKLSIHCGVSEASMSFTIISRPSSSVGACHSLTNPNSFAIEKQYHNQIIAIQLISSLCQLVSQYDKGTLMIEKGILHIFRFWVASSINDFDIGVDIHHSLRRRVSTYALNELIGLKKCRILCSDTISNFDESFIPGLFCEILSRSSMGASDSDTDNICFMLLHDFVKYVVLSHHPAEWDELDAQDKEDAIRSSLRAFDSILPSVIAGLVLEQDYDSLCKCTGFRLHLLSKLRLFERKGKLLDSDSSSILGENAWQRRKSFPDRKVFTEYLQRQTGKLCVHNDPTMPILCEILKRLLLVQEKSPFLFFQKMVVQSLTSLSSLLRETEFSVLESLVWHLGRFELVHSSKNYSSQSWKSLYSNYNAFEAMKKGTRLLYLPIENLITDDRNRNPILSMELSELSGSVTSATSEDLVYQWVQRHFMGLLVNITTKWKRGKLEKKIAAMGALRVLVRFLDETDAPHYITHVLGIIDGSMHIGIDGNCKYEDILLLQNLSIQTLSHFVRLLTATTKKEIVGNNLCNIVVSIYPLFLDNIENNTFSGANSYESLATIQRSAVELMEFLVDGPLGPTLAPYFNQVPFLPKDSQFQHVLDTLKHYNVNFDTLILLGSQGLLEGKLNDRWSQGGISNSSTDGGFTTCNEQIHLQTALSNRLNSLIGLLGHENDNVRRACLSHTIDIVKQYRSSFLSLFEMEDVSTRFLTVCAKGRFNRQGK